MNLSREILRLAVPSILAGITVPLVGLVDMAVVGHLQADGAATLLGGISVGTMLFDLLYWNFTFLRTGTGGLTAQAYGAGKDTSGILNRALLIALGSGAAMVLLQWVVLQAAFLVVDCTPQVRELASAYFRIRIWAAPATLSLFAFKGWFVGRQDTVTPMIADLLVNGLNILLSVGLGFGLAGLPRLGFAGVAWGTLIAQWCGFLYAFATAVFRTPWSIKSKSAGPQPVKLHANLILRSIGMLAVYIGYTAIAARYGDMVLALSAILMKLLMFYSYFTDGLAFAGEALSGRFIGARDPAGLKATVRGTFAWGWGLAAVFMLLYGLGGVPILRLLTSDPAVVDAGRAYIPWLLMMPLAGTPAFVWDGVYIGATAGPQLRNSTLLCAVGFFAVWFAGIASFGPRQALHVLMAAYFTHLLVRGLYLTVRCKTAVLARASDS